MIVVIADDITGAAELGGIGLRFGLNVLISSDAVPDAQTELLVIYTNTRSLNKEEAVDGMRKLTAKAKALNPSLFYKKTDSVLRGHVLAEMKAQMEVLQFSEALLVPVNPSLGRTIRDGRYYVKGQPVHETGFALDPEFPIKSSRVEEMLGAEDLPVTLVNPEAKKLQTGVTVGGAESDDDIAAWAKHDGEPVLFAGGASFFSALLQTKYEKRNYEERQMQFSSPVLLVSGTTYGKNAERIKQLGETVSYMPPAIFSTATADENEMSRWAAQIGAALSKKGKAVVAIEQGNEKADPKRLSERLSEVTRKVFEGVKIGELFIEGGATAYSIVQKLGRQSFVPTNELQQGVVRMKVAGEKDLHLTIKPGSYDWPTQWTF